MQVFIQVSLGLSEHYTFQQPLLRQVKEQLPAVITFDFDAKSDEMLITQACRLVREAGQTVIYFKVTKPNADLGGAFRLVEEVIGENKPAMILLEGTHNRLTSIIKSRPQLVFASVTNPDLIINQLTAYFNSA